ncbi:MAG: hypothetical protein Q7R96_06505, partial [Nanoarchaeota archaeon]|nr:hypothetical protein [Nanoarchaeota archaeon]
GTTTQQVFESFNHPYQEARAVNVYNRFNNPEEPTYIPCILIGRTVYTILWTNANQSFYMGGTIGKRVILREGPTVIDLGFDDHIKR